MFRFIDSLPVPQNCSLQYTHLAVLFTAGDIVNLPFQCPVLDAPDYIHDLEPAFRQRILGPDRECGRIYVSGENSFVFKLLQPLRENLWRDTIEGITKSENLRVYPSPL